MTLSQVLLSVMSGVFATRFVLFSSVLVAVPCCGVLYSLHVVMTDALFLSFPLCLFLVCRDSSVSFS